MRVLRRALAGIAWSLLAAVAFAGVALSAAALFALVPGGRRIVASIAVGKIDDALAGTLKLEAVQVLPHGGVLVKGLQVFDPDGHRVLAVRSASVFADLTGLTRREIGIRIELDGPEVALVRDADGTLALARALAPTASTAAPPAAPATVSARRPAWTVRLSRLVVRGGAVRWPEPDGPTVYAASGIDVDARGAWGPEGGFVDGRVRGRLDLPAAVPLAVDLLATLDGDSLRVSVLSARAGDDAIDAIADADVARLAGRVAVLRVGIDRARVAAFVPGTPFAGLAGRAYAESDGRVATGALRAQPGGDNPGRVSAAVAVRALPLPEAIGFDVAADRLDPSRVVTFAPPGRITLTARGAARGTGAADLAGRVDVALAPSQLRGGQVGPATLVASARAGAVEVTRFTAAAPGLSISGAGRWREGGPVEGTLTAESSDLAVVARNLGLLLERAPPPVAGPAHFDATLSGTSGAPSVRIAVDAPRLRTSGVSLSGARLDATTSGPLRSPTALVEGRIERLEAGDVDASAVLLRAQFGGEEASLTLSASVPRLGRDPVTLGVQGRLGPGRRTLALTELTFAYPGTRYQLARPAEIAFAGPSVDWLELAAGPARLGVEGGMREHGALDLHAWVTRIDLGRLPRGVLRPELGLAGELSVDARVGGTARQPAAVAHVTLAGGATHGLDGLQVLGDLRWDAASGRAGGDVGILRAAGGSIEITGDLPVRFGAARPGDAISLVVRAEALPLDALVRASEMDVAVTGALGLEATLDGTVSTPALRAKAELQGGAWRDLDDLDVRVTVEDLGDRARLGLDASRAGATLARADAEVPLDLAELLARPEAAVRRLRSAALQASATVPDLDLASLAGRAGLPDGIAGRLQASANVEGALSAPRGRLAVSLSDGSAAGYAGIGAKVEALLGADRVEAKGSVSLGSDPVLSLSASLGAPAERLAFREGLARARLSVEAVIPSVELGRAAGGAVPLEGVVQGHLVLGGTPATPTLTLEASGAGISVSGRSLGKLAVNARYAERRASADARIEAATGGTIAASLSMGVDLGLGGSGDPLARAPASLHVTATHLDLGVVPALSLGRVRTASGMLEADVSAEGPLASLQPRGSVHVTDGKAAVSEYGEWHGIALDATVDEDVFQVTRLQARRGAGKLDGSGSLRGLAGRAASLDGSVTLSSLPVARAGMELATLDLKLDAKGTLRDRKLDATVTVPSGTVRLPKQVPRSLQTLEARSDIAVGRQPARPAPGRGAEPGEAAAAGAVPPLEVRVRFEVGRIVILSDSPIINVEIKADTVFRVSGGEVLAEGSADVIRGNVEPVAGRNFEISRGRVQFTGGPPGAAVLDVQATYVNPAATIQVTVSGPALSPQLKLTSQPPMPEATIAMLIATGRTDFKPGAGGVGPTGVDAGNAAIAAFFNRAFKSLVADKLPIDTLSLDASAVRAGKYVGDKVYVGYSYNFAARPEQGENTNEFRLEYQISPRWTFQLRAGNAQSGSASLIWQRDY